MRQIISTLKLQVIKEKEYEYIYEEKQKLNSLETVANFCTKVLEMTKEPEEIIYLFTLDTKNNITGCFELSRGSINSSIVHPREVYKRAAMQNATSIILVHNHPSGESEPSHEDIVITNRLVECGKILGINLIDHIIIGDEIFFSFKGERLL